MTCGRAKRGNCEWFYYDFCSVCACCCTLTIYSRSYLALDDWRLLLSLLPLQMVLSLAYILCFPRGFFLLTSSIVVARVCFLYFSPGFNEKLLFFPARLVSVFFSSLLFFFLFIAVFLLYRKLMEGSFCPENQFHIHGAGAEKWLMTNGSWKRRIFLPIIFHN